MLGLFLVVMRRRQWVLQRCERGQELGSFEDLVTTPGRVIAADHCPGSTRYRRQAGKGCEVTGGCEVFPATSVGTRAVVLTPTLGIDVRSSKSRRAPTRVWLGTSISSRDCRVCANEVVNCGKTSPAASVADTTTVGSSSGVKIAVAR